MAERYRKCSREFKMEKKLICSLWQKIKTQKLWFGIKPDFRRANRVDDVSRLVTTPYIVVMASTFR